MTHVFVLTVYCPDSGVENYVGVFKSYPDAMNHAASIDPSYHMVFQETRNKDGELFGNQWADQTGTFYIDKVAFGQNIANPV